MIRIQTWKADRLIAQTDIADEPAAERHIDAMLTEIHQGRHGNGTFRIEADHVDKYGLYQGLYFHTPPFAYPRAEAA